jgi:hypothetical protein
MQEDRYKKKINFQTGQMRMHATTCCMLTPDQGNHLMKSTNQPGTLVVLRSNARSGGVAT